MDSCNEDYRNVEEMSVYFSKKLSVINECLKLRFMDEDSAKSVGPLLLTLAELKTVINDIIQEIKEGKEKLYEMKGLLKRVQNLNKRLCHMNEHFPVVLQNKNIQRSGYLQDDVGQVQFKSLLLETQNSIKSVVPTVEKKSKIPTRMQYLTLKEFESVPKYMKGRIRYDQINKFVDAFNDTITAKYKLLSLPRKELKQAQYKMCQALKQQENDETKGFSFCTDEDLKIYGNVKIDKMTSSMLIVLRHCSKIKLIRGPGSIVRYAILV